MARRQPQLSVTLFPFLAVLVCAMGSLILLLLVMTRKIREDQQAERRPAERPVVAAPAPPPVPRFIDRSAELQQLTQDVAAIETSAQTLRERIAKLQQDVVAQRKLVADRRAELDRLRTALASQLPAEMPDGSAKELEKLRAEEQRLVVELSAAEAALLDKRDALARAEDELREAELRLFEKSSALVALRQRATQATAAAEKLSGTETLLEFTNPTGTSRVPIVINVTGGGYELLPGGYKISAADMEQFPVRDNPLLSAVYAVHRHRSSSSVVAEPYVLLLVRPGGSLPFYGAQRIFQEARIHYGYELLQPETQLLVGSPDPTETPALQRALAEVFRRREALYSRLFEIAQEERERLEAAQPGPRNRSGAAGSGEADNAAEAGGGEPDAAGRRLAVRPDGRVVEEAGPPRRRLEGRFYAGGVAPPSTFFENRASSAVAGAPRGRLNAAQAEQMAEEFAAAYARRRALAEASEAAEAEAIAARPNPNRPVPGDTAAAEPAADLPEPAVAAEGLRAPAEQRFAQSLFGSDGSLQGSRLVGSRSDAFAGVPPASNASSAPAVTAADVLASAAPATPPSPAAGGRADAESEAQRVPWYQSSKPEPPSTGGRNGVAGLPTSENGSGGPGQAGAGDNRIDRETLRLLNGPIRRPGSSLKVPVGIVVFVDERHLAVAQQPAVALPADNPLVAEAALLQGINQELQDARRSPRDDLLPVVRFVVSPGGERWRLRLARSLKQAGIASVTQYELTPYMIPGDSAGRAELEDAAVEKSL
ncbi:MAG: hypothetical protein RLZZ436_141 [Planctomycetota bacterium]|jgi:hypothetical protein